MANPIRIKVRTFRQGVQSIILNRKIELAVRFGDVHFNPKILTSHKAGHTIWLPLMEQESWRIRAHRNAATIGQRKIKTTVQADQRQNLFESQFGESEHNHTSFVKVDSAIYTVWMSPVAVCMGVSRVKVGMFPTSLKVPLVPAGSIQMLSAFPILRSLIVQWVGVISVCQWVPATGFFGEGHKIGDDLIEGIPFDSQCVTDVLSVVNA